jgi:hypothetical protein
MGYVDERWLMCRPTSIQTDKPRDGRKWPPKVTLKQEGRRRREQGFSGVRASFPPDIFEYEKIKMSTGDNNGTLEAVHFRADAFG